MKKILSFALCLCMATVLSAQSQFVVGPGIVEGEESMLLGEAMSQNHKYVSGVDQEFNIPMIWNTETQEVIRVVVMDTVDNGNGPEPMVRAGSLHAISENGWAVGSLTRNRDYVSYPIMVSAANGQVVELYRDAVDAGAEGYGITSDGSTIVGFHFDPIMNAQACIWTNNGTVRTDLPAPTVEQMGIEYDYVSARWISADGNTILGYAQDFNTGAWVALAWKKNGNNYEPLCFSRNYFQTHAFDEDGNVVLPSNPNPYFEFHPVSISSDGNWVSLLLLDLHDPNSFDNVPMEKAGRYNLTTGQLEELNSTREYTSLEMFGIANDGTCVGRMTGEMDWETFTQPCDGVIWAPSASELQTLNEVFPNDEYLGAQQASALSNITGDASYVVGYASDADGFQTTFIVSLSALNGIADVEREQVVDPCVKGVYDLMGRKLDAPRGHGIFIIDGKKVIR